MVSFLRRSKNPDILTCLANLSSDEVFTPPAIANKMLDLLPQELFRNPFAKFLDPACKSGVFLREIVRRLIDGIADKIPDLHARVEHIMRCQVYGISLTRLTGMTSRRTVYCTMNVKSRFSQCKFDDDEGRIRYRRTAHTFIKDRSGNDKHCKFCGVSAKNYSVNDGEETHAYEFIHTERPEEILGMKFDVIISNPPYQMSDGGFGASAKPMYQMFVEQAKKLQPRYMTMIIPARWYAGGKGLDDFREEMLNDRHIRIIHDYFNSEECFDEVDLSGGVCYFLWDRDNPGDCTITNHLWKKENEPMKRPLLETGQYMFIRFNEAIPIVRKIQKFEEESFASIVSSRKPFGFATNILGEPPSEKNNIRLYSNKNVQKRKGYIARDDVKVNAEWINKWKVYISRAYGERGNLPYLVIGKPFLGEPCSACSETYLVIGPFDDELTAHNVISYMTTKFFRFLVLLFKNTQDATSKVYSLVPMQDFTRSWNDSDLYEKYGLTDSEIAFIDSMIRPMTLKEDSNS